MLYYFLAYFLLETLAFWGVAKLIGVGWALVALFLTMVFGMSIALWEVRRLLSQEVVASKDGSLFTQRHGAGKLAGNVGLTLGGGLLLSAPGFVSTFLGLLLVFPPTRSLLRKVVTFGIFRGIENAGVRFYEASTMGRPTTSYGSFSDGSPSAGSAEVIDEEELREWSDNLDPDDFHKDK